MKDFLLSSNFLWSAVIIMSVLGVIALLWRNTVWEARGITPVKDVEKLRSRVMGVFPKTLFVVYLLAVVAVLILGGLWWGLSGAPPDTPSAPSAAGTWSQALQSPSPKAVWEITKNYWLWIVLILGIPFFFLYAVEKPWAKALQWCLAAIVAMLFVVIPFVDWAWGEKSPSQQERKVVVRESGDCTYARPCPPALTATTVPGKSRVCFDPPVFANLKGFGLIVSSGGGSEHRYECTLDDVVNGICKEKPIETFRFAPDEGVIPPRHWFTNDVGQVC